jgi:hypothetical protein
MLCLKEIDNLLGILTHRREFHKNTFNLLACGEFNELVVCVVILTAHWSESIPEHDHLKRIQNGGLQ